MNFRSLMSAALALSALLIGYSVGKKLMSNFGYSTPQLV